MSLSPPITVGKLQTALHTKAKNSPGYRFYALYDKLYRQDILEWAFIRCRRNGGAPGVNRPELCGHRDVWTRPLAGRTDGRAQERDVSSPAGPTRAHSERGWQAQAARNSLHQRSCRADGCCAGLGADFRDRSGAGTTPPTARNATPWTPFAKWNGCSGRGTPKWWTQTYLDISIVFPMQSCFNRCPVGSATAACCSY